MNFYCPKSLNEALELRERHADAVVLAGGTDLCVQFRNGAINPKTVINLWSLNELSKIQVEGNQLVMGALCTHTQLAQSDIIKKNLFPLMQACTSVGARQIQNRGTIGGNVMNASPAGDTLPVLLAFDAIVLVMSVEGQREILFADFYTGYRKTVLGKNEIVTGFRMVLPTFPERAAFYKVGTRKAQAISKVSACFRLVCDDEGRIKLFKGALGSVAATPVMLCKTEHALLDKIISPDVIQQARAFAQTEVAPIDDVRSTADYRRHVAGVLLERFLLSQ